MTDSPPGDAADTALPGDDRTLKLGEGARPKTPTEALAVAAAAQTAEAHALRPGELLAQRYELLELLGRGGMGEVWKARHALLRGYRAIKVIAPALSQDGEFRSRFLHEGQVMMRVRHPGVVEVTDLDAIRGTGQLYMVMEFLEGRTLFDAARDGKTPLGDDPRETARVLREVALGMQRIHDERIIHKDLKSDNVLLVPGEDGLPHAKVIDFGVAKDAGKVDPGELKAYATSREESGVKTTLAGTPAYIAPELFHGEPSTFRSDIYSFGVVSYEVLSRGAYPLKKDSFADYFRAHKEGTSPLRVAETRPDLDAVLAGLFDRCLSPRPDGRPASFREVADALQHWLETPERRRRRNRTLATAGTGIALAGAAVWGLFFAGRTASIGPLQLASGGVVLATRADRRFHLAGAVLPSVQVTADLQGRMGRARLEVDGAPREVSFRSGDGRIRAQVDLSDLTDGPHTFALKPDEAAEFSKVEVVVDRSAPVVRAVRLEGSEGRLTNRQSPTVMVDLAEPASGIDAVVGRIGGDGPTVPAARPEAAATAWSIFVPAEKDGPVEMEIQVQDLAGNRSSKPFSYVRDTAPPRVTLKDRFGGVVQVRRADAAELAVTVDEAATVTTALGEGAPASQVLDSAGTALVRLPAVRAEGLSAKVSVRDGAGNESTAEFRVLAVEDEAAVQTPEGAAEHFTRGGGPVRLVLRRTYAGDGAAALVASRVLDARGDPTPGAPRPVAVETVRLSQDSRVLELSLAAGALEPGAWRIEPSGTADARPVPLLLTIDPDLPEVVAVRVRDAGGRVVEREAWAWTRDLRVEADVRDLSLRTIRLGETSPAEPAAPGLRTYSFAVRCGREGAIPLTLAMQDAAGNPASVPVTLRADWTDPVISLAEPVPGREYDDVELTAFAGKCSEAPFSLRIEVPGRADTPQIMESAEFRREVRLPEGNPIEVIVRATDPAGRESNPVRLSLRVRHRATVTKSEIPWSRGVSVLMRKVEAGDVVFGSRGHEVRTVFLDRTEVTNAQYRAFLVEAAKAGGHGPWCHPEEPKGWGHEPPADTWASEEWNADDLPVVNVAWWDAFAFARWSGRRLPSEAEWVKAAAKAPAEPELRSWPPFPPGEWRDGVLATAEAVGDRRRPVPADSGEDRSPWGCLHMGGNVSEWVDLAGSGQAGVRGGSWYYTKSMADVREASGKAYDRGKRAKTIGFRCAVDEGEVRR